MVKMTPDQNTPSSSTDAKLELLPRLRRDMLAASREREAQRGNGENALATRLQRMRIEDRRRERNEQMKRDRQQGRASASATSPSRQSQHNSLPIASQAASGSSASSRAGLNYYASSSQARQDRIQHDQERQLRRTFAGPVPPGSWRRRTPVDVNAINQDLTATAADDDKEDEAVIMTGSSLLDRHSILEPARHFFPKTYDRRQTITPALEGPMTLVNVTLHYLLLQSMKVDTGGAVQEREVAERLRRDLSMLPLHLKERSFALAGRFASVTPLNSTALLALLANDDELEDDEQGTQNIEADAEQEDTFDDVDSWEEPHDNDDDALQASLQSLDLSFSTASTKVIRSLLESTMLASKSLRAVSFAGWGTDAISGAPSRCLRSSARVFQLLDRFPNLETLSLAKTRLLPSNEETLFEGDSQDGSLSAAATSEALAFLRKLARRTIRLRVLDLSHCAWINGAVIANIGWYTSVAPVRRTLWTRLEHLVLWACPAFSELGDDMFKPHEHFLNLTGSPTPSAPFAGRWHAAHHGISRFTDSPYFLDHKPGLGRALLAHSVGAWDLAGRRGLVEREVSALIRHRHYGIDEQTALRGPWRSTTGSDDRPTDGGPGTAQSMWAISDGSASSSLANSSSANHTASSSEPPKCPVSGMRVSRPAWERARVLDAVRGRWGSAILGGFDDAVDSVEDDFFGESTASSRTAPTFTKSYQGAHISVYF